MNVMGKLISNIKDLQYDCGLGIHKFPHGIMESLDTKKYKTVEIKCQKCGTKRVISRLTGTSEKYFCFN